MNTATLSPAFVVTCALSKVSPEINAWANVPHRREYFETFARLVIEGGCLPPVEMRAAVVREVEHTFQAKGWSL